MDGEDEEVIQAALPGAKLLCLESPLSWLMSELNLKRLAGLAREAGVVTIIDNSWAWPLCNQFLKISTKQPQ